MEDVIKHVIYLSLLIINYYLICCSESTKYSNFPAQLLPTKKTSHTHKKLNKLNFNYFAYKI